MPPIPMPTLDAAMHDAVLLLQEMWLDAVDASSLSAREKDLYRRALTQQDSLAIFPTVNGYVAGVSADAPGIHRLEEGFAAYHLPDRINWAQAKGAKRSQAGIWYLHIPFRHLTPGAGAGGSASVQASVLPHPIYQVARRLRPGQRLTAGPTRGQAVHAPGMQSYVPAFARNVRPGYRHAARQEGLRRIPGAHGSTYLTFRTMTQQSPGWWIPARQGVQLAKHVQSLASLPIHAMVEAAARQDIEAAVVQALGGP